MKILITGTAGFIGYHLANSLIDDHHDIVGVDNINEYYDPGLKYARLKEAGIPDMRSIVNGGRLIHSQSHPNYRFLKLSLENREGIIKLFSEENFDCVIHLAAQGGVRYSLENPWAYIESNIIGTMSILEACRFHPVKQLLYASSSSVYGNSPNAPFSTEHNVDHPISLYAATKKSNELMAFTYSHLYKIPTTGLRFFTVYGPWGRPDMAYFSFAKKILNSETIDVYNHGELWRDFTYIDDIIDGILAVIKAPDILGKPTLDAPYSLYNIGNSRPAKLTDFIKILETVLERKAILNFTEMQPGDVLQTHADVSPFERDFGFKPGTSLKDGLQRFVDWYHLYYRSED